MLSCCGKCSRYTRNEKHFEEGNVLIQQNVHLICVLICQESTKQNDVQIYRACSNIYETWIFACWTPILFFFFFTTKSFRIYNAFVNKMWTNVLDESDEEVIQLSLKQRLFLQPQQN